MPINQGMFATPPPPNKFHTIFIGFCSKGWSKMVLIEINLVTLKVKVKVKLTPQNVTALTLAVIQYLRKYRP